MYVGTFTDAQVMCSTCSHDQFGLFGSDTKETRVNALALLLSNTSSQGCDSGIVQLMCLDLTLVWCRCLAKLICLGC